MQQRQKERRSSVSNLCQFCWHAPATKTIVRYEIHGEEFRVVSKRYCGLC